MGHAMQNIVFGHMRTAKTQIEDVSAQSDQGFSVRYIKKTRLYKYTENFPTNKMKKKSDKKFLYFSHFC